MCARCSMKKSKRALFFVRCTRIKSNGVKDQSYSFYLQMCMHDGNSYISRQIAVICGAAGVVIVSIVGAACGASSSANIL